MPRSSILSVVLLPLVLALGLFTWSPAPAVHAEAGRPPSATPPQEAGADAAAPESATVDGLVAALYGVISGPAGAPRDWERFRGLFAPETGRLGTVVPGADGAPALHAMTPDEYVERATPFFRDAGFHEQEIHRVVERFGDLAHVWSTYESRHDPADASPFQRGINSIQLARTGDRWRIVSLTWVPETPERPLPARYLPE